MAVKAGERLKFDTGRAEIIVTKGGDGDVHLDAGAEGELLVGKRYHDGATGIEVLVTKAGPGALTVDGASMELAQAKKTKSAD